MRPLHLSLQGFRSHCRATEIDFTGRNLIAIVGPTGSGKSSILDGISYALYGKTPREKSATKRLICSRCDEAHVRLRFSVDERNYELTRALPHKGSGKHVLEELDSGAKFVGADQVSEKVEELLGLDFDAFCSSVLLAQGQFSRFLDAKTTGRMKILKGIFRLEQVDDLRVAAKAKRDKLDIDLARLEGERKAIPADVPELLEERKKNSKELRDHLERLKGALAEEKQLLAHREQARAEVERESAGLQRLEEVQARLPEPEGLEELAREEAEVTGRLEAARAELEKSRREVEGARSERAASERKLGAEADLIEARSAAKALTETAAEVQGLDEELEELAKSVRDKTAVVKEAVAQAKDAEADLERKRAEIKRLEDAHKAHALRSTLSPGEPCPVCEQAVDDVPKRRAPTSVTAARRKEQAAEKATATAQRLVGDRERALAKAESVLEERTQARGKAAMRFKELDRTITDAIGKSDDPSAEISRRLAVLKDKMELEQAATTALEEARAAHERCDAASSKFSTRRRQTAVVLIEIAGKIELEAPDVEATCEQLSAYAARAGSALKQQTDNAHAALEKAVLKEREASDGLRELRIGLGLDEDEGIPVAIAGVEQQLKATLAKVEELEDLIVKAKELDVATKELGARRGLFKQLTNDLRNEGFIKFLLEDRRRLLSELGSARLREMTGRYRFDDLGDFNVVDELEGDKERHISTLSGGETFLASLALALALAEAVTRHGGRLQCFFLDEGFGSLDAEALDLAIDGIEAIVTPTRLIGLVSHVQALAARVEDKIELEKAPDGMTILKDGASI